MTRDVGIMASFGLYTHIRANRRRSIMLLIGLFFLVYVLLYAAALLAEALMGDASLEYLLWSAWQNFKIAWPFATAGALLWLLIAYKFHQGMIDRLTGGHAVTRQEEPRLYNLLENLCISRGLPMPKLKISEESALNAFATGLNQRQYSISVTRGLLESLNDREIEAVLGHELTHIRNGDVRMMVVAVIIAGVISFFGELVFRMLFQGGLRWGRGGSSGSSSNRKGSGGAGIAILIAVALIVLAWILSIVIRFSLSRQREFLADAGAVELTKNPDAMIMALRKIEGRGEIEGATSAVMEMCIDNPREGFADLFATHPSVDRRVKALVEFAGGRDPGRIEELPAPDVAASEASAAGPWGDASVGQGGDGKPFLPAQSPIELGPPSEGPWGGNRT